MVIYFSSDLQLTFKIIYLFYEFSTNLAISSLVLSPPQRPLCVVRDSAAWGNAKRERAEPGRKGRVMNLPVLVSYSSL